MKSSTRVLGLALILLVALTTVFPITAGARGFSDITGTQTAQQKHGFDLGRPSAVEHVVPGVTRDSGVTNRRVSPGRRSAGRHYASRKTGSRKSRKRQKSAGKTPAGNGQQDRDETTVILSESQPPRHVFISKISPANTGKAQKKDPMQNNRTRRVADILMMGIAGFSIVAALLYVLTAHRNR